MSLRRPMYLALLHVAVAGLHDLAHLELRVFDGPASSLYVAAVIHGLPLLATFRLARGQVRGGLGALALGLLGTLVYSTVRHYVWPSHDHVDHLPPGDWQAMFKVSAAALAVIDTLGLAALVVWTRRLLLPGGRHVLIVDGTCIACHRMVFEVLSHDPKGQFYFAHLQSDYGRAVRLRHGADPEDTDGVYLLCGEGTPQEKLLVDGETGRQVWPLLFPVLTPLLLMPASLLDPAYRLFARIRYRLFGRYDACYLPNVEQRRRFITGVGAF